EVLAMPADGEHLPAEQRPPEARRADALENDRIGRAPDAGDAPADGHPTRDESCRLDLGQLGHRRSGANGAASVARRGEPLVARPAGEPACPSGAVPHLARSLPVRRALADPSRPPTAPARTVPSGRP